MFKVHGVEVCSVVDGYGGYHGACSTNGCAGFLSLSKPRSRLLDTMESAVREGRASLALKYWALSWPVVYRPEEEELKREMERKSFDVEMAFLEGLPRTGSL